jgi:hypothetical protein
MGLVLGIIDWYPFGGGASNPDSDYKYQSLLSVGIIKPRNYSAVKVTVKSLTNCLIMKIDLKVTENVPENIVGQSGTRS